VDPLHYRPVRGDQLADLPMFAAPVPPSVPVDTSEAAAEHVHVTGRAAQLRVHILQLIAAQVASGLTADEIEVATGLEGNTVRPRLMELRDQGLIEASGCVKRRTRRGMLARAIYATEKGRRVLRGDLPLPAVVRRAKEGAA
jgi:hypothetical protein